MGTIKYKDLTEIISTKEIDRSALTITHYISTATPDRFGEIMNPKGCNYSEYRKNPVVFFGHQSRELPIARNESIISDDFGVIAVTKFDTSDFAKEVFRLNAEGFLNSWSIGFVPVEKPILKDKYSYYDKWNLLEYSSVPIPANPDAVNLMLKEVKNEKVREIISEQKIKSTLQKDVGQAQMSQIEQIIEDKNYELRRENEELIKKELKLFEDRLVRTLIRLKYK